jgi:ArsR family transcriptional regulator
MEAKEAIRGYAALSTDSRVNILRLLSKEKGGLASGEIARQLNVPPNTLSTQLFLLSTAQLVEQRREGRSVIYKVNQDAIKDLVSFLIDDCAGGRLKGVRIERRADNG